MKTNKNGIINTIKEGNPKTLFASFLYFDTGFTVWLLFGALGAFIAEEFGLSPSEKGFLVAIPVLAAAITRIPFGLMYQAMNARYIAVMGIFLSAVPLVYVRVMPLTYETLLLLGAFLGIGGASFAVALPMAGSNYPLRSQGLVLGLAAAGNLGAVLDGLIFPPLARVVGWKTAMLSAVILLAVSMLFIIIWARDSSDKKRKLIPYACLHFVASFIFFIAATFILQKGYLGLAGKTALLSLPLITAFFSVILLPGAYKKIMAEKDMWMFILIYGITFGGFVGLSSYISMFLIDQYAMTKIHAGMCLSLFAFIGAMIRPIGGWLADRVSGVRALLYILASIALLDGIIGLFMPPAFMGIILISLLFVAFGLGNGAAFQLVPLRWPKATGMVTGLIGAAGGVGGFYLPSVLGIVKESTGGYNKGFIIFSAISVLALALLKLMHSEWMEWARLQLDITGTRLTGLAPNGRVEMELVM